ncbi:MAG TPA: ABC transporter permease [Chloroflexota bacterium]|nr:ABC transporter permease [Chloroflexota bacterium]
MSTVATEQAVASLAPPREPSLWAERAGSVRRYLRRNPALVVGLLMLLALLVFVVVGSFMVDLQRARPLSARALQPPSAALPFGSDKQGRDLFAVMVAGTPLTIRIGLIAGLIGTTVGATLAFIGGYYGGWIDAVIRVVVDVGLTIPVLMVLIVLAMTFRSGITVDQMALIVALLAWLFPARTMRAQVLTVKERGYVQLARLSGVSGPEVIVKELLPNLLPYIVASLVGSVISAIFASIGLEILGLGSADAPTIGMTLYWVNFNAAIINGWWWWWVPPIVVIATLFIALFLITVGLDEVANPRLRRQV